MTTIRVHDWDVWQSYRKDRGTPPWIKVHRCVMTSRKWAALTDAEKGQLLSIWIVAADKNGEVPADPRVLRKVCMMDEEPDLNKFIELGFLIADGCQPDAKPAPKRQPSDVPEESRGEESREEKPLSGTKAPNGTRVDEIIHIFDFLNNKTGRNYQAKNPAGKLTKGAEKLGYLLKSGYTAQNVKTVIARKTRDWKGGEQEIYLTPDTLFRPSKFEKYLAACV